MEDNRNKMMQFLESFNNWENEITSQLQNNEIKYYEIILVPKRKIEKFLDFYTKNKQYINKEDNSDLIKNIKTNNIQLIEKIGPFKKIDTLKVCLNKNGEYVLINSDIYKLVCKNINTTNTLKCKIKDGLLNIIFDEDNVLKFQTNNLILVKSKLILQSPNKSIETIEQTSKNKTQSEVTEENINIEELKKNIEFLINLIFFYKWLREKISRSNYISDIEANQEVFLINASFLDEFKKFFESEELENFINKKDYINKVRENSKCNLFEYVVNDRLVKEIFDNLPEEYIQKIKEKKNISKLKNIKRTVTYSDITIENKKLKYLDNFEILNNDLKNIFFKLHYPMVENSITGQCHFLKNNKLFMQFKNNNKKNYYKEIGYINDNNIFIPEFIVEINDSPKAFSHLMEIFSKNFKDLSYINVKNGYHLSKDDIKLDIYKINNKCVKNYNIPGLNNLPDKVDNNNIIINDDNNKESKELKMIAQQIEVLFYFYYFEKKLEKEIKNSLIKNIDLNYCNNKMNSKCYLINNNWFSNYKNLYSYELICTYLKDKPSNQDCVENKLITEFIGKNKQRLIKNYERKMGEKIYEQVNDKSNSFEVAVEKIIDNNNEFFYLHNFEIISEEIYDKLFKNKININYGNQIEYIINNGQIIFRYEYSKKYNLLIGDFNKGLFKPDILLIFDEKSLCDEEFTILLKFKKKEYKNLNTNLNFKIYKFDTGGQSIIKNNNINSGYSEVAENLNFNEENKVIIKNEDEKGVSYKSHEHYTNNKEKQKGKLSDSIVNDIKILILLILSKIELKKRINESYDLKRKKFFESNCCLINKQWIEGIKNYYFFEDIEKCFECDDGKNLIKNYLNGKNIDTIVNNLFFLITKNIIINKLLEKNVILMNIAQKMG